MNTKEVFKCVNEVQYKVLNLSQPTKKKIAIQDIELLLTSTQGDEV